MMTFLIDLTEEEIEFIYPMINEGYRKFYQRCFQGNDLEILKELDKKGFMLSIWDEEEKELCYYLTNLFEHIYEKD